MTHVALSNHELAILDEQAAFGFQILVEAEERYKLATQCLMCGASVAVAPTTMIARVHLDEPTRPLCGPPCTARYESWEAGR